MKHSLKLWEGAALWALCLALLAACPARGRQTEPERNLIRLHVIAASDAPEEQALKLEVRDAVLAYLSPVLEGVTERAEAEARLRAHLDGLAAAAERAAEGRPVRVLLGETRYPAASFPGGTLPAGRYESLRVVLGEGEGHNWWGLLFPQLALPAAEGGLRETMALDSFRLLTDQEGYEIRFRVPEILAELQNRLGNRLQ